MLFQKDITIPANTTQAVPATAWLPIARGIITQFMVLIPAGHASLAHLQIYHGAHVIAPSTDDMDIHGDKVLLDWNEYYEFYQSPYFLKLVGWNEDDTFPHRFIVYCVVLPRRALVAPSIADGLKGLFSALSPKRIFTGVK